MGKHGIDSCEYGVKRSGRSNMDNVERTQKEDPLDYSAYIKRTEDVEDDESETDTALAAGDNNNAIEEEANEVEEVEEYADVDEENDGENSCSNIACDNCIGL